MVMKKRSPKSKKPSVRRKAASKSSRKNPSWGDVRAAASRAHGTVSRAYERAKPRAKQAAASARSAAERGYAYAKPRVKAGTRRVLSGISALSARGAKALENPSRSRTAAKPRRAAPTARKRR